MAKYPMNVAGIRLYEGKYPHVTDILSEAESRFFKDLRDRGGKKFEKTMETARETGTRVHALAEKIAKTHGTGETVKVDPLMLDFALAIRDFLNEWVEEVIATEQDLCSHVHGYAGRTDLIGRVTDKHGGGIAVFDLKTSKSLSRENGLQLAAYKIAAREQGYPVERRFAVQIKKHGDSTGTGEYYVREYKDHALDKACWLGILAWFYWHKRRLFEHLRETA